MDQHSIDATSIVSGAISGLPQYLTSFLGREDELARLRELLLGPAIRLVTITGFGGIGKTRLATALVTSMTGDWRRVWFVSLALVHESTAATSLITRELGIEDDDVLADRSIRHALQTAPCLLVLDNFEHLVDAADQIPALLQTWPLLTVLVTSRVPLNLSSEYVVPLSPLATTDEMPGNAIQLFHERARAHGGLIGPQDTTTVVEICQRLEGIPLAVELAAARTPMLTATTILNHLASPLTLLTGGPRDAPARQRTLRNTIAWSYNLLTVPEQQVLEGLAVFSGGFTAEAAAVVLDLPTSDLMDRLAALVDSSLVQPATPPVPTQMRFRLLDPVREFTFDHLTAAGAAPMRQLAHARYFTALAEDFTPRCSGPELPTINQLACAEVDNFRVAIAWALTNKEWEIAVRLAGAIWRYWPVPGMGEHITWRARLDEGRRLIELTLEHAGDLPIRSVREALLGLNFLDDNLGKVDRHPHPIDMLLQRGIAEHDPDAVFHGTLYSWMRSMRFDEPLIDIDATETALVTLAWQTVRPLNAVVEVYLCMGAMLWGTAQYAEATPIILRAHELSQQGGNPLWIARSAQQVAELALDAGDLAGALRLIRVGLHEQSRIGSSFGVTALGLPAARIATRSGRADLALKMVALHQQASLRLMGDNAWYYEHATEELRALTDAKMMQQALTDPAFGAEVTLDSLFEELERHLAGTLLVTPEAPSPELPVTTSLTSREIEVLHLLARGDSNRAIADALFISERTVENHVRSILARLNVANRAGAAAWAVRHNLA